MEILVSASRALNGSSSRSSDGDLTRARASETRCASPPDRVSGQADDPLGEPDLLERVRGHPGRLGSAQPERDVVEHPLPRHQARFLEGDRDRLGHGHRPRHVPVEPGERPQQRGLARPAPPDHRDELAGLDVQAEPVEHHPVAEPLREARAPRRRPDRSRSPSRWLVVPVSPAHCTNSRRHASALRSTTRTAQSASSPRIAYTIRQTMMMLFCQELLGRGDHEAEPGVGVDLLAHDQREQRADHAQPEPGQRRGERAGQHDVPHQLPAGQPEHLAELAELGVDAADAREGVDVHREQRAEQDDEDLGQLADAEPDDEQRQQAEQRDRPSGVERPGRRRTRRSRLSPLATASSTAIVTPMDNPMPQRSAETSSDAWSVP